MKKKEKTSKKNIFTCDKCKEKVSQLYGHCDRGITKMLCRSCKSGAPL